MKRLIAVLLCVALACSMTACGKSDSTGGGAAAPAPTSAAGSASAETAAEISDTLVAFREEMSKLRSDLILKKNDAVKFKNPDDAETVFQILMLMAEGYAARCRSEEITEYDLLVKEFQKMIAAIRRNFYKEEYLL